MTTSGFSLDFLPGGIWSTVKKYWEWKTDSMIAWYKSKSIANIDALLAKDSFVEPVLLNIMIGKIWQLGWLQCLLDPDIVIDIFKLLRKDGVDKKWGLSCCVMLVLILRRVHTFSLLCTFSPSKYKKENKIRKGELDDIITCSMHGVWIWYRVHISIGHLVVMVRLDDFLSPKGNDGMKVV